MFRTVQPIETRVYALVNASVVLLALLAVLAAVHRGRMPEGFGEFLAIRITVKNLVMAAAFLVSSILVFHAFGLSRPSPAAPFRHELLQVTKACTVASLIALLFSFTSHSGAFPARALPGFLPAAIVACLLGRSAARAFVASMTGRRRDLIIVGSGPRAAALYRHMREPEGGSTRILGFLDSPPGRAAPGFIRKQMLGNLDDLEGILVKRPVDEVLIALPAKSCYDQIQAAIQTCERVGVEARYLSDVFELQLAKPQFVPDEQTPLVALKVVQDDCRLMVKRGIDILGAVAGLVLSAPLMLVIAAAIRLTSPGPVIFQQLRYGLHRRRFPMYKFRTMLPDAERLQPAIEHLNEAQGPVFKIRNDPRITPIGRLLRRTSLDELPQFWNVLTGDMSLVGPRPLPARDVSRFDDSSLMRRFSVKPGLTCLWQISGRSNTDFHRWIQLDLQYIDEWSIAMDLSILLRTVAAVITSEGAV